MEDDKKMPGALKRLAGMRAKKKMSKMGKAYNKMEKSKDFKPLPFLDGPKRKDVKGGPSDVESYMKKMPFNKSKETGITQLPFKKSNNPRMRKMKNK
jgi:hypothetical protein